MWDSFWAGLLVGLILWVLVEEKDLGLLAERLPKADPRRQGR